MASQRKSSRGESLLLRYAILGAWALFCLAPVLWFLSIGLRPRTEIITPQPIYWPSFSLDAWHMIWEDWPMAKYLRNSVAAIFGSVIIDLAVPAAYSLARYTYRGRDDIGFYILSTRMMAPAIVAIPIFFLFRNLGLLDTIWALMLIYAAINLSFVTWIIRSYMLDIPKELEDAARTDVGGAGELHRRIRRSDLQCNCTGCLPRLCAGLPGGCRHSEAPVARSDHGRSERIRIWRELN